MPFNPSGVFTRLYRWVTDRDNNIPIDSTRMDAEIDGMVAGLNAVVNQTQAFTGNIKAPVGTALTPAFSFSNDPDTGVYRAGANTVGISAGGAVALTVAPTGITSAQPLDMGAKLITNLGPATAGAHAPRLDQVVPRDGSAAMSGPLQVPLGTDAAPGLQFGTVANGIRWVNAAGPVFTVGGTAIARLNVGTALSTAESIVTRQAGDGRYVQGTRTITTGNGLSGGGDLSADRTVSLALASLPFSGALNIPQLIAVEGDGSGSQGRIGAVFLKSNFGLADSGRTITAGNGLSGGGDLTANRTIALGTPSSITATSTNSTTATSHTHDLPQSAFREMSATYLAYGAIGSCLWASNRSGVDKAPGATIAGSDLYPAGDGQHVPNPLTGTWRCLGDGRGQAGTLWMRIS